MFGIDTLEMAILLHITDNEFLLGRISFQRKLRLFFFLLARGEQARAHIRWALKLLDIRHFLFVNTVQDDPKSFARLVDLFFGVEVALVVEVTRCVQLPVGRLRETGRGQARVGLRFVILS